MRVILTLLVIEVCLKLDGLLNWHWVSVLWPIFLVLSIMFIASLISLFVFIAWMCTWMAGNTERLKKNQESDSTIQCKRLNKLHTYQFLYHFGCL